MRPADPGARHHLTVQLGGAAELLLPRAAEAAAELRAFPIRLGAFGCEDQGRGGVFVMVEDVRGGLETVRDRLLLPPQRFGGYPFHTTVAHARTSARAAACWAQLRGGAVDLRFTVRDLLWTAIDATTRTVLGRFPLTGRSPRERGAGGARPGTPGPAASGPAVVAGCLGRAGWTCRTRRVTETCAVARAARGTGHRRRHRAAVAPSGRRRPGIELSLRIVRRWRGGIGNRAPHDHEQLRWFAERDLGTPALAHPAYATVLRDALTD